jgi:cytoskeletal protein RodZ
MALSMDEQRVLAEIERRLAAEDPGLAASLTTFRRPGPAAALRSPRARFIGSLFTVMVVAMISLMVYALIPFRGHAVRTPSEGSATSPEHTTLTTPGIPRETHFSAAPASNTKAKAGAASPASAVRAKATAKASTSTSAAKTPKPASQRTSAKAKSAGSASPG